MEVISRVIDSGYIKYNDLGEEEIIPIPYNTNNRLITSNEVINILLKLDVSVGKLNNLSVIQQAFVHKSYIDKKIIPENMLQKAKNELGFSSSINIQEGLEDTIKWYKQEIQK